MRLYYVANIRLPTERAHGAQVMSMCEAFVRAGAQVELVVPERRTIREDPFSYYGIQARFAVRVLPVLDLVSWGRVGFYIESLTFALRAALALRGKQGVVYGRDELVLALLLCAGREVVWEDHRGSTNAAARFVARRARLVVAISEGLMEHHLRRGVQGERTMVAHDGVDLAAFAHPEPRELARRRLGLPLEERVALYIGSVGEGKGVETLAETAALLKDTIVAVIGGEERELLALRRRYPLVRFLGARPYRDLADNEQAADVLVVPNSGRYELWARFTSPLKLFAAMASGVPMVVSDTPSMREVVDESCATLVPPDDPAALAPGKVALQHQDERRMALLAKERVRAYDWLMRAQAILSRMGTTA